MSIQARYELRVTSYELRVTSYELRVDGVNLTGNRRGIEYSCLITRCRVAAQ
jgi:hypothetical protein